jgi:hypothetical protein
MLITGRDEQMLEWLGVVRVADMDALRFALAAFSRAAEPVSLRRAQQWVARLRGVGLVDRARPALRDGSIVWATPQAIGKAAPKLLQQTTRHEVAVAAASARYLFHGWDWHRDRKATGIYDHQADGVATRGSEVRLVEVELTPKTLDRYNGICTSHAWRMANEGVTRIDYLCTDDAARTVSREADKWIFRGDRALLVVHPAFDERGVWTDVPDAFWDRPVVDAPRELTTRLF